MENNFITTHHTLIMFISK